MRKISLFLILVLLFVPALSSCGNRDYDEETVKAAARELLEKSTAVNEIFYGVGMPVDEGTAGTGYYKPVKKEYLSSLGIAGLDGLRNLTKEVYTDELSDIIFETKLNSVKDSSGNIIVYSRYIEAKIKDETRVLIYTAGEPTYQNDVEYLYDTLTVKGSKGERIIAELDVRLITFDGFSRDEKIEIILLEENDGFRLDSLSFAKY